MSRFRFLLPLLILTACAPAQNVTSTSPATGALNDLRRDQAELQARVISLENQLALLQSRLDEEQARREQPSAAPEMGTARGQITETGYIRPAVTPAATEPTAGESPTQIYLQAFSGYAAGRYAEAIDGFRRFLEEHPNNSFAGNAQFWLGECYYKQRLLTRAASEFAKVVSIDSAGAKAPDALLRMAQIYRELNQPMLAEQALQRLHEDYPDSAAARKADSP